MGASGTEPVTVEACVPNPPRERKFQVVPVPGVFKRGRWRCWDFSDSNPPTELKDSRLLDFDRESESHEDSDEPMPENEVDSPATVETFASFSGNDAILPGKSESSTILVTSIRPAPATPQHRMESEVEAQIYTPTTSAMPREIISTKTITVSPANQPIQATVSINTTPDPTSIQTQVVPCTNTPVMNIINNGAQQIQPPTSLPMSTASQLVPSIPQMVVTTPVASISAPSNAHITSSTPCIPVPNPTFEILSQVNLPASNSCSSEEYSQQHGVINTTQSPGTIPVTAQASQSQQDFVVLPLTQSSLPSVDPVEEESATTINVVAIDNKIEQAMDLVKTHLTFAVREEVEVLRNTIVELEAKVVNLESQNAFLKQFVPPDVLNNLPMFIQKQKAQQSASTAPQPSAAPTLAPLQMPPLKPLSQNVTVPPEFKTCPVTVNFESTLNNVVAEVRNAVSGGHYTLSSLGTPPKSFGHHQ